MALIQLDNKTNTEAKILLEIQLQRVILPFKKVPDSKTTFITFISPLIQESYLIQSRVIVVYLLLEGSPSRKTQYP